MYSAALIVALAASQAPAVPPEPIGSPSDWVTVDDYPAEAMRNGDGGTVKFELAVTATGKVDTCTVIASSGTPVLDDRTCAIMLERARFRPGRDAQGSPVASTFVQNVKWETWAVAAESAAGQPSGDDGYPGLDIVDLESADRPDRTILEFRISIDEAGRVASCEVTESQGTSFPHGGPCGAIAVGQQIRPIFTRDGKPVRSIQIQRTTVEEHFD